MENSDVEAWAKLLFCTLAEFSNFQLTDLVAEALSRPCDVTIDLSLNRRLVRCAALAKVGHGIIAAPAFRVNTGINYQANRAHQFRGEPPIIGCRVLKESDLLPECLCVNGPTLGIRIVDEMKAKLRQSPKLMLNRNLQVMAGNALVVCNRFVAQ